MLFGAFAACAEDALLTGTFQSDPNVRVGVHGVVGIADHGAVLQDEGKSNGLKFSIYPFQHIVAESDVDSTQVFLQLRQVSSRGVLGDMDIDVSGLHRFCGCFRLGLRSGIDAEHDNGHAEEEGDVFHVPKLRSFS